jgi:hypothetical protein
MEFKVCRICNEKLSVDLYYKNKTQKDGLHSYCKECTKEKSKKWQEENHERCQQGFNKREDNVNISRKKRTGETKRNNFGSLMEIAEYKTYSNITVRFPETNTLVNTGYNYFLKGAVKNPYDKTVYGIGYNGRGKYKASENGKKSLAYLTWIEMIRRCYSETLHKRSPTYRDCSVCSEWHNFQNFGVWFDDNYYKIDNEVMNLDKDILMKGNKIYSPETCVFVPGRINTLFIKRSTKKGKYPIGVGYNKKSKIYMAKCKIGDEKVVHVGSYKTSIEAFYGYKEYKENHIKQVADNYKNKIPDNLYKAMYSYEVNITD